MAIWYVNSAATGAGDGTSEADAFTTLDAGFSEATLGAGDKIWVKAGSYTEDAVIDTAGAIGNHIVVEGYTTSTGDGGKATITGTTNCISCSIASIYYTFKNLILTGASSHGADMGASTGDRTHWYNCEFNSNGGDGFAGDISHTFVNCEFTSNTGDGADLGSANIFIGCIFASNSGLGVNSSGSSNGFYKNVIYGTGDTDSCAVFTGATLVAGNTIDGENSATYGLDFGSDTQVVIVDNIVYDCATAINNSSLYDYGSFAGYNLLNSNTTDYANTGEMTGVNDVSGAPAFTDEANDDYTLGASSPAIDAGIQPGGVT